MQRGLMIVAWMIVARAAAAQPSLTAPLSPEDRAVIAQGELGEGRYVAGAVSSIAFGFGTGQAIQGRWHDTGWIFTLGDAVTLGAFLAGASSGGFGDCFQQCPRPSRTSAGLVIGGLLGYTLVHLWEVSDAIVTPREHDRRYRAAVARSRGDSASIAPYVALPAARGDGAGAGVSVRF